MEKEQFTKRITEIEADMFHLALSILHREQDCLDAVQEAVDAERVRPARELKPLVKYPVKRNLYDHQVRASNMCLLTFGLVEPFKEDAKDGSS